MSLEEKVFIYYIFKKKSFQLFKQKKRKSLKLNLYFSQISFEKINCHKVISREIGNQIYSLPLLLLIFTIHNRTSKRAILETKYNFFVLSIPFDSLTCQVENSGGNLVRKLIVSRKIYFKVGLWIVKIETNYSNLEKHSETNYQKILS